MQARAEGRRNWEYPAPISIQYYRNNLNVRRVGSVFRAYCVTYIYFVKTLEDEFWEKYGLMEDVMDSFIISVGEIDSSKEGSNSVDCS